jgi:hypothetical protein
MRARASSLPAEEESCLAATESNRQYRTLALVRLGFGRLQIHVGAKRAGPERETVLSVLKRPPSKKLPPATAASHSPVAHPLPASRAGIVSAARDRSANLALGNLDEERIAAVGAAVLDSHFGGTANKRSKAPRL